MTCTRLNQSTLAPNRWHTLWCAECRAAREADAITALGIECMKAQPYSEQGLASTLEAIGLPPLITRRRQPSWLVRRRFATSLAIWAGLFTVMSAGWLAYINIDSTIPILAQDRPTHNGYEYFVAAAYHIVDEIDIVSFASSGARRAALSLPVDRRLAQMNGTDTRIPLARKVREDLVKENSNAILLVRQGFDFPCAAPFRPTFTDNGMDLGKFEILARLFSLKAGYNVDQQDWMGSANSSLDAIELGARLARGGTIRDKVTSTKCEAIGITALWNTLGHLSAKESRAVLQRMEKIRALHVPFGDILENEKWATVSGLQDLLRRPYPFSILFSEHEQPAINLQAMAVCLKMLTLSKRQVVERYVDYMDQAIAEIRIPRAGIRPQKVETPDDPVSARFTPVFEDERLRDLDTELREGFLFTTIALRAYRLEHGAYPKALTDLVPNYMTRLCGDPFAGADVVPRVTMQHQQPVLSYNYPGLALKYQRRGKSYILYSNGPDQFDDHGAPLKDHGMSLGSDYRDPLSGDPQIVDGRLSWESTGDIIARNLEN